MPVSKKRIKKVKKITPRSKARSMLTELMTEVFTLKDKLNCEHEVFTSRYGYELKTIETLDEPTRTEALTILNESECLYREKYVDINNHIDQTIITMDKVATDAKDILSDTYTNWSIMKGEINEHIDALQQALFSITNLFTNWFGFSIDNITTYAEKSVVLIEEYNKSKAAVQTVPDATIVDEEVNDE